MLNETVSRRSLPTESGAEIICGDCAGDDALPVTTKLTSDGRCADCGGRSIIAAPSFGTANSQHRFTTTKDKNYEQLEIAAAAGNRF
jgi:hypothetical protein